MSAQVATLQGRPDLLRKLDKQQRHLVERAQHLAQSLHEKAKEDKERQLRNIQAMAEQGSCWSLVELFIRYQAARGQLPASWDNIAISELARLRDLAQSLVGAGDEGLVEQVHLELVKRVLGYTVWWHIWDVKKREREKRRRP